MIKVKLFSIYFVAAVLVMTLGAWVSNIDINNQWKMVLVYSVACLAAYFLHMISEEARIEKDGLSGEDE